MKRLEIYVSMELYKMGNSHPGSMIVLPESIDINMDLEAL